MRRSSPCPGRKANATSSTSQNSLAPVASSKNPSTSPNSSKPSTKNSPSSDNEPTEFLRPCHHCQCTVDSLSLAVNRGKCLAMDRPVVMILAGRKAPVRNEYLHKRIDLSCLIHFPLSRKS